jgi:hypothetical protein
MHKEEVIKKIGKHRWKSFLKFMAGQTIGIYPDGSDNYYAWDVETFLNDPRNTLF